MTARPRKVPAPAVEQPVEPAPLQLSAWLQVSPTRRVEIVYELPAVAWWTSEACRVGGDLHARILSVTDIELVPRDAQVPPAG